MRVTYQDHQGGSHEHVYEVFGQPAVEAVPVHLDPAHPQRPAIGEWSRLAGLADQWFAAHLQLSVVTEGFQPNLSPWIFSAGHALELYLKSAVAATESMQVAISLSHKMKDLWNHCESYDHFPLLGLLRPDYLNLDRDIYSPGKRDQLPVEERLHLSDNEILYLSLRHVQDLKYLGTPGKTFRGDIRPAFGIRIPNRVMISQLGKIAHWAWGQWACQPGHNNVSLYKLANQHMSGPSAQNTP